MNLFGLRMIWSMRVDRLPKRAVMALQPNMQATSPSFQKNICGTLLGKLRIHHRSDHCFLILTALLILQLGK